MRLLSLAGALATTLATLGCGPSAQTGGDSVSVTPAALTPGVVATPPDSASPGTTGSGAVVNRATSTTSSAPTSAPPKSPLPKAPAKTTGGSGDSIIGYDRVIRLPPRPFPAASSTPTR